MRNPFITECSASPAADNSFVENLGFFQQRKHPYSENFINKNGRRFYESAGASAKHFFCKDKISSILARHEVEKIPVKIAAGWTIKHHYLGSFPSATNCCRLFRRGDSYGHRRFTYGSIQKLRVPNIFGPAHAKDCLLLQRFALEDPLEFNAGSLFSRPCLYVVEIGSRSPFPLLAVYSFLIFNLVLALSTLLLSDAKISAKLLR